jgi:probable F420-dependent oxidoreductase
MKVGIAFLGSPADAGRLAAEAEEAGAQAFLCGETDHSAFGCAIAAGQATRQLTVGTSVSLVFPRSPTIAAMEAWSLASVAPGRSLYGLGSQVRQVVERRFGSEFDPPVARMREYVETMRRVLEACRTGEAEPFEGEHYHITQLSFHAVPQPDVAEIPLFLGAVGPRMIQLAAEHFDGLLGHGLATPRYLSERIRPVIGALPLNSAVMASIDEDEEAARRRARQTVAFYGTTHAYEPIFEVEGLAHLPPLLREAFRERRTDELLRLVDDEVADRFMLTGTPAQVAQSLRRYEGILDIAALGGIGVGASRDEVISNNRGLIEVCRRYRALST